MIPARSPSPFAFLPTTVLLLVVGWGGLFVLLSATEPTLLPRWLFFFLVVVAFTGLGLPVVSFLNNRFPSDPPAPTRVILREALWVGAYFSTLAWFRYGQILNGPLAVIVAIAFLGIEVFLRLRERSQWQQPPEQGES